MDVGAFIRASVLPHWAGLEGGLVTPLGAGLINQTYLVDAAGGQFVLQRVNPIFPAEIHENILAVTRRLPERGLLSPVLLPTRAGRACLELGAEGVWRAMTFVSVRRPSIVSARARSVRTA